MSRRRPPPPRLDPGTKIYYKRIESVLEGESEGAEGAIYLKNVVDQVVTDGARLVSCDKDGSKALELLLRHYTVNLHSLNKLMKAVRQDFFKLCVNRCGSHVMQALLVMAGRALSGYHTEDGKDDEVMQLFMEFVYVFQERLSDCIRHPYASHVLGVVLQVLGGMKLADKLGRSRYSLEFRSAKMTSAEKVTVPELMPVVPEVFCKSLDKIAKKISKLGDLEGLLTHQNASPVIHCLLCVLATRLPERANKLTKKIVKLSHVLEQDGSVHSSHPEMFTDLVGSHLMETVLQLALPHQQELIFERCLKDRVLMTALHPVANFPLRQLIGSANPDLLTKLVAELGALEEVLFVGHTGLVVKLVESAIACPDIQHNVFTSLMKAFHTEDHPKSSAPVILALLTYELFYEDGIEGRDGEEQQVKVKSHPLTLHGSLLLQALLKFQHPRTVVRSLLAQDVEALVRVSCDSSGSHVLTAFLSSHTVPTKKKEKMMKKLVSKLVPLCVDRYGSRVIDMLWKVSDVERKKEMVKILLAHEEELAADFHGSIVLRNCNIAHFRSQQEGWLEGQKMAGKRKELFQEIFDVNCHSRGEGKRKKLKRMSDDMIAG